MTEIKSFSPRPVIIGAGLAGLTTALALAPVPVVVLASRPLGEGSSSAWAQGGIAAAVGVDDAPALHAADTVKAGAGLCDAEIVRAVTEGGAAVIEKLTAHGIVFDRDASGQLQLGLEGAHGKRRIVHAGGDGAGKAIMQALIAAVRATSSIEIIENAAATNLLVGDHGIRGVEFLHNGKHETLASNRVVLATGGAGALWQHTTNPLSSWGQGLALAARAGAELADLEFMQFHPTAIDIGRDPMPLASEALRGEGAVLVDESGERFMKNFARGELEPRDVVSRAIWAHMNKGHRVFLDARNIGADFAARFPAIYASCMAAGIDPSQAPIPVRPAAHYHMGGVMVDADGRSSVPGLWACGEVAATGLHGANRLASNSLLEAAYFGEKVAESLRAYHDMHRERMAPPPNLPHEGGGTVPDAAARSVRKIMSAHVGVLRDEDGLERAVQELTVLAAQSDMALVALMIAVAALRREESRGSHTRTDFSATSEKWQRRQTIILGDVMKPAPKKEKRISLAVGG